MATRHHLEIDETLDLDGYRCSFCGSENWIGMRMGYSGMMFSCRECVRDLAQWVADTLYGSHDLKRRDEDLGEVVRTVAHTLHWHYRNRGGGYNTPHEESWSDFLDYWETYWEQQRQRNGDNDEY